MRVQWASFRGQAGQTERVQNATKRRPRPCLDCLVRRSSVATDCHKTLYNSHLCLTRELRPETLADSCPPMPFPKHSITCGLVSTNTA